jgi:hypothetical protein
MGVDPSSNEGRVALGRELQLSAWMTGVVKKRSGKLKLTVVVFDGAQHSLVGRTRLVGKTPSKLSEEIKDHLWRKSRYAIQFATAPGAAGAAAAAGGVATAATTPAEVSVSGGEAPAAAAASDMTIAVEDAESPPKNDEVASASAADLDDEYGDEPSHHHAEAFRASFGVGSPFRNLAYSGPITTSLGDYTMSGAPMFDVNAQFYPAAPFTDGVASWFGLEVRGAFALSTPTSDRDGNKFNSRYDAYHVGMRARMPLGAHYISAFTGYGMNRFAISSDNKDLIAPTPSVDYRMIRTGLGGELGLSDTFRLGLDAAFLSFLSVGDIGKWFPRAQAAGLELSANASYSLTQGLFARFGMSYQRTFFDFNGQPDDKYRAQGATDQYLSVSVGAGVRL